MYKKFEQNKYFNIVKKAINSLKPKLISAGLLMAIIFLAVQNVYSAVGIRQTINFQGKLVNSSGLNVADSTYSVVFSLYTASSGGSNIWQETQSVPTIDGLFRVELGSSTSLSGVDFNQDGLYLGIKVGADAEMTPRVRFTATPYAFQAKNVSWSGLQNPTANTSLNMGAYTNSLIFSGTSASSDLFVLSSSANTTGTGRLMSLRTATDSEISPFHVSAKGVEALLVASSGNVGIGTTSPAQKLEVVGNILASNIISGTSFRGGLGSISAPTFSFTSDPNTGIFSRTDILGLVTSGTEQMTILSNGNVGIGTTAPIRQFSVGSDANDIFTELYTSGTSVSILASESNAWKDTDLAFYTTKTTGGNNFGERMRITSQGNVGIGTATTDFRLEVNKGNLDDVLKLVSSRNAGGASMVSLNHNRGTTNVQNGDQVSLFDTYTDSNTTANAIRTYVRHVTVDRTNGTQKSGLSFWTQNSSSTVAEVMRISGGNVGIGTANPEKTLEINGDILLSYNSTPKKLFFERSDGGATGQIYMDGVSQSSNMVINSASGTGTINLAVDGTSSIYVNSARNVGIGTTSPGSRLDIVGSTISAETAIVRYYDGSNVLRSIIGKRGAQDWYLNDGTNNIGTIAFGTPSSNPGITFYTGAPPNFLNRFDMYNAGTTFVLKYNAASTGIIIDNTGNVGIGTASPQNRLHVQGTNSGSAGIYLNSAVPSNTSYTLYNNNGTLTWNGTALGTGSSVSGTTGYIPRFTASNALGNSQIFDNGTSVGIGTTNPGYKIDVDGGNTTQNARFYSPSSVASSIIIGGTANNSFSSLQLISNSGATEIWKSGTTYTTYGGALALNIYNSNGAIAFHPNNQQNAMFLDTAGNVGIGTTSPESKLNVLHTISSNAVQYAGISELDFTSTANNLNESFGFGATIRFKGTSGNDSTDNKGLSAFSFNAFNSNTGTVDYMQGMYGDVRNLSTGTVTNFSGIRLPGGVNSGGGTITNFYGLLVEAQSVGTNRYALSLNNAAATNVYNVYAGGTAQNYFAGNVGIGTATTDFKLEVNKGNLDDVLKLVSSRNTGGASMVSLNHNRGTANVQNGDQVSLFDTYTDSNTTANAIRTYVRHVTVDRTNGTQKSGLSFWTQNGSSTVAEVMRISGGNVGIGTTNPIWTLDLYKPGDSTRIHLGSDAPGKTNTYLFTSSDTNGYFGIQHVKTAGSAYGDIVLNPDGGNVGIGTTNPGAKLEVASSDPITLRLGRIGASSNSGTIAFANSNGNQGFMGVMSNSRIGFSSNQDLASGNRTFFVLDTSNDRVGIGTTNPQSLLHVSGSGDAAISIESTSATEWRLFTDNTGTFKIRNQDSALNAIVIENNASSNSLYLKNGNVGIGTTNPSTMLDIFGTSSALQLSYDANDYARFSIASDGKLTLAGVSSGGSLTNIANFSTTQANFDVPTSFNSVGDISVAYDINLSNQTASNIKSDGPLTISSGEVFENLDLTLRTYGSGKFVVNSRNFWSDGDRVGIGTTAPSGKLSVRDNGYNNLISLGGSIQDNIGYLSFWSNSSPNRQLTVGGIDGIRFLYGEHTAATEAMRISGSGNVGIGTADPGAKLQISGGNSSFALFGPNATWSGKLFVGAGTNQSVALTAQVISTDGNLHIDPAPNKNIFIGYYQPRDIFINALGGNVGIGTTSIGSKLTIGTSFATTNGITVDSDNSGDSQIVLRKYLNKAAFGALAWEGEVYLSSGIYYDGGTWVHHNSTDDNQLLMLQPSTGVSWYSSNNATSSWNVANNIQLWDNNGNWKSVVQSTRTGNSYFTGGNVGIGTASPVYPLDVKVASDTIISIFSAGSTGYFNSRNVANTLNQPLAIAGSTIGFDISGTRRVSIDTNGVGIGTTSPSSRLEITSGGTGAENAYGTVRVNVTPGLYASGTSTGTAIGLMSNTSFANQGATAQLALIQQTANANDINAGVYLSIKGWFQNSSTSLPIAIGGGYSGITPSIFIAGAGGNGGGNVGIGTTNPGAKLEVAQGNINVSRDDAHAFISVRSSGVSNLPGLDFYRSTGTIAAPFAVNAQNVLGLIRGWGYNSSSYNIGAGITFYAAENWTTAANGSYMTFGTNAIGTTASTERMRIDPSGNVGIGTTNPGYRLDLPNVANTTGQGRANAWVTYSDLSLKENISPLIDSLDKVISLRGVSFEWKGSGIASSGFIAQEVEKIIPDLVSTDIAGIKAIDYSRLTPYLVSAIQEQQLQIEQNSTALQTLDPEVINMQARLVSLEAENALTEDAASITDNLFSLITSSIERITSLEDSVSELLSRVDSLVAPQVTASDSARIEDLSQRLSFVEAMFMGEMSQGLNSTISAQLASSITENEIIFEKNIVSENNLTVLAETNLNNVGVTGVISNNLLLINGFDESLATPGASISTVTGALNIQKNSLNEIKFMGESFKMDTDGNFIIHKGNLEVAMGSVKGNDGVRGINVAVEEGKGELKVIFKEANDTANYAVGISPSWFTSFMVTGKDKFGFTVKFSSPAPVGGKIDWIVIE